MHPVLSFWCTLYCTVKQLWDTLYYYYMTHCNEITTHPVLCHYDTPCIAVMTHPVSSYHYETTCIENTTYLVYIAIMLYPVLGLRDRYPVLQLRRTLYQASLGDNLYCKYDAPCITFTRHNVLHPVLHLRDALYCTLKPLWTPRMI